MNENYKGLHKQQNEDGFSIVCLSTDSNSRERPSSLGGLEVLPRVLLFHFLRDLDPEPKSPKAKNVTPDLDPRPRVPI